MYSELESRNTVVVAVSQEDADLESHAKFLKKFKDAPTFDIAADIGHATTKRYHQTTAYLIDREGVVRQVFPMLVHHRATWEAVFREIDRLKLD